MAALGSNASYVRIIILSKQLTSLTSLVMHCWLRPLKFFSDTSAISVLLFPDDDNSVVDKASLIMALDRSLIHSLS